MTSKLSYIDIFSGCGGISLGLHNAGWQGLFAIEKHPDAFSTLKHNLIDTNPNFIWPSWLEMKNWDIDRLLKNKSDNLGELRNSVDLVVGGPPCQGFSAAGKRSTSDIRNRLVHAYIRFVEQVQPRVIVFENVRGFTYLFPNSKKRSKRSYSDVVLAKLRGLGYHDAHGEMIDFSEFGVPQRRQRFIVVGSLDGFAGDVFAILKEKTGTFLASRNLPPKNTITDALSDLVYGNGKLDSPDTPGFKAGITSQPRSALQKYLRLPSEESYVPDSHRYVNHSTSTTKVFERLLSDAPRDKVIKGEERDIYGVRKRSITVLDPDKPSPTITTIPDDFVHYSEPRVMTVRECARLQTFPDWFKFRGPYTSGGKLRSRQTPRYTQVGNAVPPLFAEQLGIAIRQVLENE